MNRSKQFTAIDYLKAEWAAKVFKEANREKTTARALHYFALGRDDYHVFSRNGLRETRIYQDGDARIFSDWVALAKRMGVIRWDAVPDETVGEYGDLEYVPTDMAFSYEYSLGRPDMASLREYLERKTIAAEYYSLEMAQPYHLELWVEKSTMNNILQPVCDRYNAVLVTFRGHPSWGAAWKMCNRALKDGRLTILLYLSDMDASGFLMAHELCDKVAEINQNFFNGGLDIRIRRIGLTPQQVRENNIPLVVRKETERNNFRLYREYVESAGLDYTKKAELDALERYYSGGIQAFVSEWLERYYDTTLEDRCKKENDRLVESIPGVAELPEEVARRREQILKELDELAEIENKIDIPEGGEIESSIEPITDDPNNDEWLLDLENQIYPKYGDVDVAGDDENG